MLRFTVCVVLGICCLVTVPPSSAKSRPDLTAVVQEVDAKTGTISVLLGDAGKKTQVKTLNLSRPDLPVTDASGKAIQLTDLPIGERMLLTIADNGDVLAIRMAPPSLFGHVLRIDPKTRTLVLRAFAVEKTVRLPDDVKIIVSNQPAKFEDLVVGYPTLVVYSADKKAIQEVRSAKAMLPIARLTKRVGTLIALDPDKLTAEIMVHVSPEGDIHALRHLSFRKEPGVELLYFGKHVREASLADVARGIKVYFWTEIGTNKIGHLSVEMPVLGKRQVKSYDPARRRLILADPEGDKEVSVSAHVIVQTPKGPGRIEDLQAGRAVRCGLSADRRQVEFLYISPE